MCLCKFLVGYSFTQQNTFFFFFKEKCFQIFKESNYIFLWFNTTHKRWFTFLLTSETSKAFLHTVTQQAAIWLLAESHKKKKEWRNLQDSEDEYLREMTNKRLWHKKTCVESHIQPKLSGETFFKQDRHTILLVFPTPANTWLVSSIATSMDVTITITVRSSVLQTRQTNIISLFYYELVTTTALKK